MMDANNARAGSAAADAGWLAPVRLMGALAALACLYVLVFRLSVVQAGDVGWLLTCAEWLLDGRQMSVDFFEVNPPGAVLIYLPVAALARLLHVNADPVLELMVLALVAATIRLFIVRVLGDAAGAAVRAGFVALLVLVLLVYPGRDFAQREHIVVLLLLPWLVLAARPDLPASRLLRCAAGIALGGVVMAKPYFVIVPVAVELFRLARTRDIKAMFNLQNIVAILAGLAYVASIYLLFPAYLTNVLPHVLAIYAPVHWPLLTILTSVESLLFLTFAGFAVLTRKRPGDDARVNGNIWAADAVLIAAIAAFVAAMLQVKGFRYHFLPAVALAVLGAALNVYFHAMTGQYNRRAIAGVLAFLVVLCVGHSLNGEDLGTIRRTKGLAQVVAGLGPAPRIIAIGGDTDVGFPVVRLVKGSYVQRQPFLWMAASATRLQALTPEAKWQPALYDRYYALEREILIEDITKGKPTVMLIEDGKWSRLPWAMQDPRFVALFADYRRIATVDDVTVFARNP